MAIRTSRQIVTFSSPFSLASVGRILPAGSYEVITDEEMIEGLSFPVYRRVATMMLAHTKTSGIEMLIVDPADLAEAKKRDLHSATCQVDSVRRKFDNVTATPTRESGRRK